MAGNDVKISIIAQAEDAATAELQKVEARMRSLNKQLRLAEKESEKGSKGLRGLASAANTQVEAVDKAKNKIDQLRGIVEFALPIIGGLVSGVAATTVEFLGLFDKIGNAKQLADLTAAFSAAATNVYGFRDALRAAGVDADKLAGKITEAQRKILKAQIEGFRGAGDDDAVARAEQALASLDSGDRARNAKAQTKELREQMAAAEAILDSRRKELHVAQDVVGELEFAAKMAMSRSDTERAAAEAALAQAQTELLYVEAAYSSAKRAVDEFRDVAAGADKILDAAAKVPTGGGGGGGTTPTRPPRRPSRRPPQQASFQTSGSVIASLNAGQAAFDQAQAAADAAALSIDEDVLNSADRWLEQQSEAADLLAKARSEAEAFADTIRGSMTPALGEWGGALELVASAMQATIVGSDGAGKSAAAAAGAVASAAASMIKDRAAYAAVEAAIQTGLGIAMSFLNPAEAATHFAAAAALGIAAAMGGMAGVGGGSRGGGSQRPANDNRRGGGSSDSGDRVVVYNISAGVADGQGIVRTIRQSERQAAGTGVDRRRGW